MNERNNIADLASRLAAGSLARDLVTACQGVTTSEARAEAMGKVLQQRFEEILAEGTRNAEVQDA